MQPNKLSRSDLHAIWLTTVRAIFDLQIVAFNPPEFLKSLLEGIHFGSTYRVDFVKPQHADPPDLRGLCVRPQRPCRRADQCCNELPPPHGLPRVENDGLQQGFATRDIGFRDQVRGSSFEPTTSALG